MWTKRHVDKEDYPSNPARGRRIAMPMKSALPLLHVSEQVQLIKVLSRQSGNAYERASSVNKVLSRWSGNACERASSVNKVLSRRSSNACEQANSVNKGESIARPVISASTANLFYSFIHAVWQGAAELPLCRYQLVADTTMRTTPSISAMNASLDLGGLKLNMHPNRSIERQRRRPEAAVKLAPVGEHERLCRVGERRPGDWSGKAVSRRQYWESVLPETGSQTSKYRATWEASGQKAMFRAPWETGGTLGRPWEDMGDRGKMGTPV
ncbi:hypothetical protein BGX38DRAFT_1277062 [Terfezia claveryi]|nr:hypothetical protein BGX38DRAFT_1277062 [Terfezia claveryi]